MPNCLLGDGRRWETDLTPATVDLHYDGGPAIFRRAAPEYQKRPALAPARLVA
jgi:hypothetical protein